VVKSDLKYTIANDPNLLMAFTFHRRWRTASVDRRSFSFTEARALF